MVLLDNIHSVISRSPATLANDIIKWDPDSYLKNNA